MEPKFLVCDLSLIDKQNLISDRFVDYNNPERVDYFWNTPGVHEPISWHSYAAVMHGRYVSAPLDNWKKHVEWSDYILFTFTYNCRMAEQVIEYTKKLTDKKRLIIGAFHENGDRIQDLARQNLNWLKDFKDCCNVCDYILSYPKKSLFQKFYKNIGIKTKQVYIPQAYYIKKYKELIIPLSERNGIFIGPVKKDSEIEHRNFIYNVFFACGYLTKETGNRITLINSSSTTNEEVKRILTEIRPDVNFNVVGRQSNVDFIKLIAGHCATINFDSSQTQGQTCATSLLVDVPLILNSEFLTDYSELWLNNKNLNSPQIFMENFCSFDSVKNQLNELYEKFIK